MRKGEAPHRVVRLYFGGMAQHLKTLRPALKPGARLAYVVGDPASYFRIPIHTGEILAEVAEGLSYDVSGRDLFRTRFATATQEEPPIATTASSRPTI